MTPESATLYQKHTLMNLIFTTSNLLISDAMGNLNPSLTEIWRERFDPVMSAYRSK